MSTNRRDLSAGLLCILGAAASGAYCLTSLELGTPLRMGAGFYPLLLSIILLCLGTVLAVSAVRANRNQDCSPSLRWHAIFGNLPWRAISMLVLAPLSFAIPIDYCGFVVSVALLFSLSALSSSGLGIRNLTLLTIGMTTLCVLIFYTALGLPLSLTGALWSEYGALPWNS